MGGWIWLGIFVVTAFVIWRKARKRAGGASINGGAISRDADTNYGHIQVHGQHQGQSGGGAGFTGG